MPISSSIDPATRLKTVEFRGFISEQEFVDYCSDFRNNCEDHRAVFVDFSQMDECDLRYSHVSPHAEAVNQWALAHPGVPEIILAPSDVSFGLARMYQTLAEGMNVQIFRDESAARAELNRLLAGPGSSPR